LIKLEEDLVLVTAQVLDLELVMGQIQLEQMLE